MIDFTAMAESKSKNTKQDIAVISNQLDRTQAQAQLAIYHQAVEEMLKKAEKVEVKDEKTNQLAVDMTAQVKRLWKQIEKKRKELVEAPNQYVKAVNNFARSFQDKLRNIERMLKQKIADYHRAEAEKQKAILEKQLKNMKKGQADQALAIPKEKQITRTETGAVAYQKKVWDFEIIDESQIPREYLCPNVKKIREAIRMGVREIPGIKIYEKLDINLRT